MAAPFQDLVEESFDEAVFLWQRWETDLASLTRNVDDVWSWTEDRLHGALDGVRAGGPSSVDLAAQAVRSDEFARVTVGTALLASSADDAATSAMATAVKNATGKLLDAMVRGVELLASDQSLRAAAAALEASGPEGLGALCRVKAFRRLAPGSELAAAFTSNHPSAQAEAMRAARLVTSGAADEWLHAALHSEDADVQYAAVESGLCLRIRDAWERRSSP